MNKQPDPRETLLHDLLQTFIDEYREISEVWRDLDKKANNTATISGIFIAGGSCSGPAQYRDRDRSGGNQPV